jgi:hypothetical protein
MAIWRISFVCSELTIPSQLHCPQLSLSVTEVLLQKQQRGFGFVSKGLNNPDINTTDWLSSIYVVQTTAFPMAISQL